jgi:hypothetical protein
VAGVHRLERVEGLTAADLSNDEPVGAQPVKCVKLSQSTYRRPCDQRKRMDSLSAASVSSHDLTSDQISTASRGRRAIAK